MRRKLRTGLRSRCRTIPCAPLPSPLQACITLSCAVVHCTPQLRSVVDLTDAIIMLCASFGVPLLLSSVYRCWLKALDACSKAGVPVASQIVRSLACSIAPSHLVFIRRPYMMSTFTERLQHALSGVQQSELIQNSSPKLDHRALSRPQAPPGSPSLSPCLPTSPTLRPSAPASPPTSPCGPQGRTPPSNRTSSRRVSRKREKPAKQSLVVLVAEGVCLSVDTSVHQSGCSCRQHCERESGD